MLGALVAAACAGLPLDGAGPVATGFAYVAELAAAAPVAGTLAVSLAPVALVGEGYLSAGPALASFGLPPSLAVGAGETTLVAFPAAEMLLAAGYAIGVYWADELPLAAVVF